MPRKTKRQKILARLHRLEQKPEKVFEESDGNQTSLKIDQTQVSLEDSKPKESPQPKAKTTAYDYSYVYRDIRKIIILSALALGVEILLSLTASNSYAKLVLRTLNLDF